MTAFPFKVHVRCELPVAPNIIFLAASAEPDFRFATRVIALGTVAQASQKTLAVLFDPADVTSGPAFGCAASDCRPLKAISLTEAGPPVPPPPPPPPPKKTNGQSCTHASECQSGRCQASKCEAKPAPTPTEVCFKACDTSRQSCNVAASRGGTALLACTSRWRDCKERCP